jgi:hypothetical protein
MASGLRPVISAMKGISQAQIPGRENIFLGRVVLFWGRRSLDCLLNRSINSLKGIVKTG